jgi:hypothetical protein
MLDRAGLVVAGQKTRIDSDRFDVAELADIRNLAQDASCGGLANAGNRGEQYSLPAA